MRSYRECDAVRHPNNVHDRVTQPLCRCMFHSSILRILHNSFACTVTVLLLFQTVSKLLKLFFHFKSNAHFTLSWIFFLGIKLT